MLKVLIASEAYSGPPHPEAAAEGAPRRQCSEILFEPAGEDPVGVDLQDAERLLDQR
ncbi:MAG: hypothetical protein JWQ56_125 [Pseudarthrobacter sp.]|nr:hypothetical protein [Pseudarthrobacter sp.]